ncbi:MAG: prolyl oligopeptidase family serine peptidase [Planctomycetes bacterium]|nr:prolyl oligopeptidase family serine peptidase [Planctomycetota bacterium]
MKSQHQVTRRDLFRIGGTHALGWAMAEAYLSSPLFAEDSSNHKSLNRFPNMLQRYFVQQVRQLDEARDLRLAKLSSAADAQAYVESVRGKIRESFGPFPEKTPLNARVTSIVERDTYRIENILFESRPGMIVSANLYVPTGREYPLPGIVGTCGHSRNGKAETAYQSFAQGLARQGYVVLIYDPIGQGERLQYPDEHLKSKVGVGVAEHLKAGNQQFLVGEFFGNWRAWDGIRALDYLLSRKEVDPNQVGVTGNSGGGTMTTWLCGVESRWTMAAPSCFVTTFRRNLENELPTDTEQCPPKALALGLEHEDFLAALAPKPIIILAKEKDFFDVRGSEQAYRRLKKLYRLLGKEENIALFTGPTAHGYSQENREAMYGFFNNVTKISDSNSEPALKIEKDKTLQCTPNGQVAELGSKTVQTFTREISQQLAKSRGKVPPEKLIPILENYLQLADRPAAPDYRILRPLPKSQRVGYPKSKPYATTYAVGTEPGIEALVYRLDKKNRLSRPPADSKRAILYVSHLSSDNELRNEPLIRDLLTAEPDSTLYTVDVRGIGESQPGTCDHNSFHSAYGSDFFYSIHSLMLDRPYPAQRTHDLLSVLGLLKNVGHTEIHLAAKGWGTIPATFAAILHDTVKQVTLKNSLSSYTTLAESEDYDWPLSSLLPGVLQHFDLPDCYTALAAKQLHQIDPWGAKYNTKFAS